MPAAPAARRALLRVALACGVVLVVLFVALVAVPVIVDAVSLAASIHRAPTDSATPAPRPLARNGAEVWWAASVALSVVVLGGLAIVGRLLWRRNR